jgi:hypothetical protein
MSIDVDVTGCGDEGAPSNVSRKTDPDGNGVALGAPEVADGTGVFVRVGVRVGVLVEAPGVAVRVGVLVGPTAVAVRVGVAVPATAVGVFVGDGAAPPVCTVPYIENSDLTAAVQRVGAFGGKAP